MNNIFTEKIFTILLSIIYIIALVSVFYHFETIASILVVLIVCLFVIFLNFGFKKSIILFLIFLLGILRAGQETNKESILDNIYTKDVVLYGQIISSKDVNLLKRKIKFYLKVNSLNLYNKEFDNINSKVLVSLDLDNNLENKIIIGDYISIKGKLRPVSDSTNPHQFNYKKYLENNDCVNILYGNNNDFKVIKEVEFNKNINDSWFYILKQFELTRNKILEKHSKNIKSPKLEILGGIVFGNETINPDETIKSQFKNSGLLHLLAASGLNVALIYGIWWWIASLICFPYNLSILIGAVFVVLYTFMTGFPPSILRASIMLLFVLFGKIIDRKASSVALIFFVGFLILLFNPKMIFDIGFQLSFMVTIGLITCCPVIIEKFDNLDKKYKEKYENSSRFEKYIRFLFSPKNLVGIVVVPLVAQLWVIPLQLHYFNNFAPLSILANIAVVPFIGILSFIGFVSSIIALIPWLSTPLVYVFDLIANPLLILLIKISEIFSSFKYSLIGTFGFNLFQIFSFWLIILLAILNIKYNFKIKKYIIVLCSVFLLFLLSFIKIPNDNLEIAMFDVQNADSFLIKTPENKYIMIDTGKKTYKGSTDANIIINPYIRNERIKRIDYLIVTHFDSDHCGGVIDILSNFNVKNVIIQNGKNKNEVSKEIINYFKRNKTKYKILENDEIIYFEKDLTLKGILPKVEAKNYDNENSIINLLSFKDKNILFMADVGIVGFNNVLERLPEKIDILKLGHHGAKDTIDEKILNKINPKIVLISSGGIRFNHPHYSIVNLLNEKNIKFITTKNYGFTKVILKNDEFEFKHFDSDKQKYENVLFNMEPSVPFHKSKYFQDLIQKNMIQ